MLKVEGSHVYIDIEIDGQRLTEDFVKQNNIEMFTFKIALTAGFAMPTINLIMGGTNLPYFNKFKEINKARAFIGTSPNEMESFDWEIVGRDIKPDAQDATFILHTGGVLTREKFSTMFGKDFLDGIRKGNALEVLKQAWKEDIGTDIDSNIGDTEDISRAYKRNQRTLQVYLADVFTHIDIRPSFPLATIDKKCNLVLRDFQKLKKEGPSHILTYARAHMPEPKKGTSIIPYVGKPICVSYKTYANRYCGYKQISGQNMDTGKLSTLAISMNNDSEGWGLNKLATTMFNESSPIEHRAIDRQGVVISKDTPESYWETAIFNKDNNVNMSSVQTKVIVEGRYLPKLKVLDLVKLDTLNDTKVAGLYIVEALEIGFISGSPFTNVVWLCRDNYNDVENSKSKLLKLDIKSLNISPKDKAKMINGVRSARRGLVHAQGLLDNTYKNDLQRHLISLGSALTTNFELFGINFDIHDKESLATSLRNQGNLLANKLIDKFVAPPLNRTFYNFLTGSATQQNILFSLISAILGADIYGEFISLFGDFIMFDSFLDNYLKNVKKVKSRTAYSSSGGTSAEVANAYSIYDNPNTYLSFSETPDNTLFYEKRETPMLTSENKSRLVSSIVEDIKSNIPDAVDLPIPEIEISDSDAIKPEEDIKEIIVNDIVDDLVNKGYVYDSNLSDDIRFVQANGNVISIADAKKTMLSSNRMSDILSGNVLMDSVASSKITNAVGEEMKIRHWGTFISEEDLLEHNITNGFSDRYKTVNCTKRMSVRAGKRIFVALPSSEKNLKFYINSNRVIMNEMEIDGLGYYNVRNKMIPYTIYYTTEGYNSNNTTLEIRKEV